MTNAEVLQSYRYGLMELRALDRQMDTLMRMSGPAGLPGGLRSPSHTNDPQARLSQNLTACEEQMERSRQRLVDLTGQFEAVLTSLPDQRSRTVLRLYYAAGCTDGEIAETTGLSERTISRIRNRACARCPIASQV